MPEVFSLYGSVEVRSKNAIAGLKAVEAQARLTQKAVERVGGGPGAARVPTAAPRFVDRTASVTSRTRGKSAGSAYTGDPLMAAARRNGVRMEAERAGRQAVLTSQLGREQKARQVVLKRQNVDEIKRIRTEERQKKTRSGGGLFGNIVGGNLAANAISQFGGLLLEGGATLLAYSSKLEQTAVSFKTLLGSSEAAAVHIKDLQRFAATTPFEFAELTGASRRLQNVGFSAKEVIPLMRDIGNAASAAGASQEDLNGITLAMSQIAAKGKVSAEELNQLGERGIPGLKILSESLGITKAEVMKLGEQGKLSSETFFRAFSQYSRLNYGDAMEAQSKTFAGAMSNIKDSVLITGAKAFEPLYAKISETANELATRLNGEQDFGAVGAAIAEAIARGLGASLGDALSKEIDAIGAGKGDLSAWYRTNANVGGALQQGAMGERQNYLDLLKDSYSLMGKNELTTGDLPALENLNYFGKFDAIINKLKAELAASPGAKIVADATKGVAQNGIKYVYDPKTGTVGQSYEKTAPDPAKLLEEGQRLTAGRAAQDAVRHNKELNMAYAAQSLAIARANASRTNTLDDIKNIAAAEEDAIRSQIAAVHDAGAAKAQALGKDLTEDERGKINREGLLETIKLETQLAVARINTAEEIKRKEEEILKLRREYRGIIADSQSIITGSPVAAMFDDAKAAIEGAYDKFKDFDIGLARTAANATRLSEAFKMGKAAFESGMTGVDFRQQATRERLRRPDEMNGFGRRLGGLEQTLDFAGQAANYRSEARGADFYANLNLRSPQNNPADIERNERLDKLDDYDRFVDRSSQLRGKFGKLGIEGEGAIAAARLSAMTPLSELVENIKNAEDFSGDYSARGQDAKALAERSRAGLAITARLNRTLAARADKRLQDQIEKNAVVQQTTLPFAQQKLDQLNKDKGLLNRKDFLDRFLAITGELGDEITPEMSKMRVSVLEARGAIEEKNRKELIDVIKSLGGTFKDSENVVFINNAKDSAQVTRKPKAADVARRYGR